MILYQDPRDPEFVQNPYVLYKNWHEDQQPVFWQNYGLWCLYRFDEVNEVLRDRRFARLPPAGHPKPELPDHLADFATAERYSLLAMEPPQHTRLRKAVNRAFVGRNVNNMETGIRQIADECLNALPTDTPCDLLRRYATPIPLSVITTLLGVDSRHGDDLLRWSHAMVRVYTLTQTHEEELIANEAAGQFQAFVKNILHQKRLQPGDDLISQLLKEQAGENGLSDDELVSVIILLLNAGHEATVHQLGNAINRLLRHYPLTRRDTLLDILASNKQADALVTECLRYDAPLHLFTRYAQEDIKLNDAITLKAGEQVALMLAAANRCPARFETPDTFDPTRGDGGQLSLGAGIHFCVGAQLARLELRIALQTLFERYPATELAEPAKYQNAYHFHGLEALSVICRQ